MKRKIDKLYKKLADTIYSKTETMKILLILSEEITSFSGVFLEDFYGTNYCVFIENPMK